MAERGGQVGNQNAVRAKRWREAIIRAIARNGGSVDLGLDKAADKLVTMAIDDGDKWAIEEIGNRLDGRPAQALIGGDEDDPPIKVQKVERVLVRADIKD